MTTSQGTLDFLLDQLAQEPEMHRRHTDCYAYEFFVIRRVPNHNAGGAA